MQNLGWWSGPCSLCPLKANLDYCAGTAARIVAFAEADQCKSATRIVPVAAPINKNKSELSLLGTAYFGSI